MDSSSSIGLTESERLLIEGSFAHIISLSGQFTTNFYKLLFERYPEVREMFPPDMDAQKDKFALMLATFVEYLDDPDKFYEELNGLAARHATYGAQLAHYQAVGECFIETLKKDPDFGPDELHAWNSLYKVISTSMLIVSR